MSKQYEAKAKMFASLSQGGHLQVYELINYPGVEVVNEQKTRKDKWTRKFLFDGIEYPNIEEAVKAHELKTSEALKVNE